MNYDINLKGLGKLYYPVVWLWKFLYSTITPRFWNGVVSLATNDIPIVLRILILLIVSIIILCVYIAVWGILMAAIFSLAVLTSVVYAITAIANVIGGWWEFWTISIPKITPEILKFC